MSMDAEREMEKDKEPESNAPNAAGGSMPEGVANSAMTNFRQGFFTASRYGMLLALGEEPKDYQRMRVSLLEDLQPRPGLESHLAERKGETFWRMRFCKALKTPSYAGCGALSMSSGRSGKE